MGIKPEDLKENLCRVQDPRLRAQLKEVYEKHVAPKPAPVAPAVSHSEPQQDSRMPLDDHPANEGRREDRVKVRIVRKSCRLLDADNFAGGSKFLIDALRHAGLITDDDPETVLLEFKQDQVKTAAEEGTEIFITYEK